MVSIAFGKGAEGCYTKQSSGWSTITSQSKTEFVQSLEVYKILALYRQSSMLALKAMRYKVFSTSAMESILGILV